MRLHGFLIILGGMICRPIRVPANTIRSPNVDSMLAHRLRRWANIEPALSERLVIAGISLDLPICYAYSDM